MTRMVLIVDDDAEFRRLAASVVGSWGHRVVAEAGTCADAIVTTNAVRPDVALVDVGLPDGDGLALTVRLRELPVPPRVILISSDARATTQHAAHQAGAAGFVPKQDFTDAVLRRLVEEQGDEP